MIERLIFALVVVVVGLLLARAIREWAAYSREVERLEREVAEADRLARCRTAADRLEASAEYSQRRLRDAMRGTTDRRTGGS